MRKTNLRTKPRQSWKDKFSVGSMWVFKNIWNNYVYMVLGTDRTHLIVYNLTEQKCEILYKEVPLVAHAQKLNWTYLTNQGKEQNAVVIVEE